MNMVDFCISEEADAHRLAADSMARHSERSGARGMRGLQHDCRGSGSRSI